MKPTRRDLIAASLAVTAGCHSDAAPPLPPGEVVGASDSLGHRLRDGWRPEPAADAWTRHKVVIVGGGAAGLAAAWRLRRKGVTDFALLELEPAVGGTARGGEAAVGGYPWGAHYVPAPLAGNPLLVELLREIGAVEGTHPDGSPVIAEGVLCRDPQERLFFRGRWYEGLYLHAGESPDDAEQLRRFHAEVGRWAGWRDAQGRRAFAIPVATGSDDPAVTALDRLSFADWLAANRFTSPRVRWLADYACRDDYGLTADQASAWAGLFYFASRLKGLGAEPQPLMTWPEGNARLIRHLADAAKEQVQPGWAAADVRPAGDGVEVVAVSHDGARVRGLRAERVIVATPQFVARQLVKPLRENPQAWRSAFTYGAWLVANLHLKDRPTALGAAPAWDNVLYESPSLGYVVATHQRGLDHGPTVWTYYLPLTDADPRAARARLLGTGRDGWAETVLADLSMAHPEIRRLVTRLDVVRWGHAMVRPVPGFVWGPDRRRAAEPVGRIHFAGADLGGVPIFEEALYHGARAADEARGAA